MNSKAEPVDMHIVAFSDEDLDRLWVCVRHCRRAMESNPESEELAGDLEMLEKTLSGDRSMKTPEHLRAFDNYAVLVPGGVPGAGEDRWIEERSLAEAVRTAQTFCRANRRRTTIHHKRFGLVAAVRPIGQTSIVVWYLDPKYSKAIEVITWSVLVGGILIWLVTLSALA